MGTTRVTVYPGWMEVPAGAVGSGPYSPTWLDPADVKSWLSIPVEDTKDDELINSVCAATEPFVSDRCRPEWWVTDPDFPDQRTYVPDAETYQGAVMLAAREYRRKNSPGGIESYGDGGMSFVSRWDPDIDRALQTGDYARPVVS